MSCSNVCKLCNKFILSTAVNFDTATNELIINLPTGAYYNCEKYCIVVAQAIPTATTANATVVVTITGDTTGTRYPLVDCDCQPVSACAIRTRTRYSTIVRTNATSGVFRLLGKSGYCQDSLLSLPIPAPVVAAAEVAEVAEVRALSTRKTPVQTKGVTENA